MIFKEKGKILILIFLLIIGIGFGAYFYLKSQKEKPSLPQKPEALTSQLKKFSSCQKLAKVFEKRRKETYKELEKLALTPEEDGRGGGGEDYSETNIQVEGVDEADIVKTDGEYIYTISENKIKIVKAIPPEEAKVISTLDFPEKAEVSEIFIYKDKLLAMGTKSVLQKPIIEGLPKWYEEELKKSYSFIKVWDLKDEENPKLTRDVEFEGDYLTSRKIEERVYIVINTYPFFKIVKEEASAEALIPTYSELKKKGEPQYKPACKCEQVEYFETAYTQAISQEKSANFLSVLTISISDDQKDVDKKVILGNSDVVYASLNNLYLTSAVYEENEWTASKIEIHKFALKKDGTEYLKSGKVEGRILNQFSLDEHNGYFRVATTKGSLWEKEKKSTNNVYILDEKLEIVGKAEGLAEGEEIYSARFVGDKGYLVTFKKIDPFFTLDLKDPQNPKVLGKLKIPGYSDYLHPYDENHIIGLGKNTVEATEELKKEGDIDFAWYQGIKIAIFDVSDFENPKELYKTDIGDRGTDSYALFDHKAFLFDKKKNLLIIPVLLAELSEEQKKKGESSDYGKFTYQGAYVYNISLDKGFNLLGRISHYPDEKFTAKEGYGYYGDTLSVQRALYIKDKLYTISQEKILINNLSDLKEIKEINLK